VDWIDSVLTGLFIDVLTILIQFGCH